MDTEVTTQSVREKIRLKALPMVFVATGLACLAAAGALLLSKTKQTTPAPSATTVFQAPQAGLYVPGQILVKFKDTEADTQSILTEAFKQPQQVYFNKQTGATVQQVTPMITSDTKNYGQKTVTLTLKESKPLFTTTALSAVAVEKLTKRGIQEPEKKLSNVGLDRWHQVAVNNDASIADLVSRLTSNSAVESAEPNYLAGVSVDSGTDLIEIPDDGGGGGSSNGPPVPNDPYFSSTGAWGNAYRDQWGPERIDVSGAWVHTTGSVTVVVAVSDTGIDYNHPDIQNQMWNNTDEAPGDVNSDNCPGICGVDDDGDGKVDEDSNRIQPGEPGYSNNLKNDDDENGFVDDMRGYDFSTCANSNCNTLKPRDNNPIDEMGHGTHVAGSIGASVNNGIGIAGLNWNVRLMPVQGLNRYGIGLVSDLAETITYAVNNGADVINMSWGGSSSSQAQIDALDYAAAQGVVSVAAAGNNNGDASGIFPANHRRAITVSAIDPNNQKASFSNYGLKIDVAAPGVEILSLRATGTDLYLGSAGYTPGSRIVPTCSDTSGNPNACPSNQYYRANGTSMAAPHVAGVAALILARSPGLSPEQVRQALRHSATDIGASGFDTTYGFGRLNAATAISETSPPGVLLTGPLTPPILDEAATVTGLVTGANVVSWELAYGSGPLPVSWTTITSGTGPVPGLNYAWDIQSVNAGNYVLRLSALTTAGQTYTDHLAVVIDPTLHAGWPLNLGQVYEGSFLLLPKNLLTVADINGGGAELMVGSGNAVRIFRHDGTILWQRPVYGRLTRGVVVADVDRNGSPEVFTIDDLGWLFGWSSSGTTLPGFPFRVAPDEAELTVDDLDGANGTMELIVYFWAGDLKVYNFGNPPTLRWSQSTGDTNWPDKTAVGDVDLDGHKELVVTANGHVKLYSYTGSLVRQWNNVSPRGNNPLLADINGNGNLEIIVGDNCSFYFTCSQSPAGLTTGVHVLDPQTGGELPGWPQNTGLNKGFNTPAVGDIDGDGSPEIVAGLSFSNPNRLYAWQANGALLSGWPVTVNYVFPPTFTTFNSFLAPIIADIDSDGRQDVIASGDQYTVGSAIRAYRFDGQLVAGFPKATLHVGAHYTNTPAVADLDNDGLLELAWIDRNYNMYVWDLTAPATNQQSWPMFQHDAQHTGANATPAAPPPPPPIGPVISNVAVTFGGSMATVSWQTDVATDGVINYGPTSAYGTILQDFAFTMSHAINLSVTPSTLYHYTIRGCTQTGLCTTTPDATFTAPTPGGPVISNVAVTFGSGTATVSWTTDIAADGVVNYGLTPSYGPIAQSFSFTTSKALTLNVAPGTYHYSIRACTQTGLCNSTTDATFIKP